MRVDGHIPCGTAQRLPLSVWYMLLCDWVPVLFNHAEIHQINQVVGGGCPNQKVVRFDIPVNEIVLMNKLDPFNHLFGHLCHSFNAKPSTTPFKQIFQRRPQKLDD
ncbi:hypothetical protein OGAPHI_004319 [Ogataea philodendri]|uniref:Uncharacterized protein n=1 Tax=Ogataea philodendri TaxID=1378263 RepID=A0A9P8P6V6_9ASCO|nr:uncharacterized protein OGAPHI_004319 [Ogataea philodendri]KAH3666130.1 hypothetical protein OGAPHI_004319 [Ogataea philodendri]